MNLNSVGTILRIALIAIGLVAIWYISISAVYLLISVLFGIEFSFTVSALLFVAVMFLRMFYPKNVFI